MKKVLNTVLPYADERRAVALLLKKYGAGSVLWFLPVQKSEVPYGKEAN